LILKISLFGIKSFNGDFIGGSISSVVFGITSFGLLMFLYTRMTNETRTITTIGSNIALNLEFSVELLSDIMLAITLVPFVERFIGLVGETVGDIVIIML